MVKLREYTAVYQPKKPVAVELKIRWDGTAPGLAEHRLSVGAFGDALPLLLAALRRIATQIVRTAVEGESPQTGRFANLARQLDIEITQVEGNSCGINAEVSFRDAGGEAALAFADLPSKSSLELLDAIDRETQRRPTNSAVKKYLKALPPGVHRQVYELYEGGVVSKRVDVGDVNFSELPPALPFLRQYEGMIVGVGFEPGKNEVRVKTETNSNMTLQAPADYVERAIEYRIEKVRAISVHDEKKGRLIGLQKASDPKFELTREAVEAHIFKRWNTLLGQLAK